MNWKDPFKLALELALFSIGWILVLIVVLFIFAVVFALVKAVASMFKKKNKKPELTLDKLVRDFKLIKEKDKDK